MSSSEPPYAEGERVFGPPSGTYDADWVAAAACQQDPGLPPETAEMLAARRGRCCGRSASSTPRRWPAP